MVFAWVIALILAGNKYRRPVVVDRREILEKVSEARSTYYPPGRALSASDVHMNAWRMRYPERGAAVSAVKGLALPPPIGPAVAGSLFKKNLDYNRAMRQANPRLAGMALKRIPEKSAPYLGSASNPDQSFSRAPVMASSALHEYGHADSKSRFRTGLSDAANSFVLPWGDSVEYTVNKLRPGYAHRRTVAEERRAWKFADSEARRLGKYTPAYREARDKSLATYDPNRTGDWGNGSTYKGMSPQYARNATADMLRQDRSTDTPRPTLTPSELQSIRRRHGLEHVPAALAESAAYYTKAPAVTVPWRYQHMAAPVQDMAKGVAGTISGLRATAGARPAPTTR